MLTKLPAPHNRMTEREVASITGVSISTLRRWRRLRNAGPPWMRTTAIIYDRIGLVLWLGSRPSGGQRESKLYRPSSMTLAEYGSSLRGLTI
jgi:transcriptional regulator with XRE-family HTH domain